MKELLYITLGLMVIAIVSCNKIDDPFPKKLITVEDTTSTDTIIGSGNVCPTAADLASVVRRILVEDYTGHTCGNCPAAAVVAKDLNLTYPQTVNVGVHAGSFAEPYGGGSEFLTDFRTPAGTIYNDDFSVSGNPKGMVSRSDALNGEPVLLINQWESAILEIKDLAPEFYIGLDLKYTSSSRKLDLTVGSYPLVDLSGDYNLVIMLIEDSIMDWQTNYDPGGDPSYATGNISNYYHRHVLRDNMNLSAGPYGEEIITGGTLADTCITTTYTYTISSDYDAEQCAVVAFIAKTDTREVMQVEEIHVIEKH